MLAGVGLIFVSYSPAFLLGCFSVLSPLHIYCTTKLLQVTQFEVLNQPKASLLAQGFVDLGKVYSPAELRENERIFGEWLPKRNQMRKINLGATIEQTFGENSDALATALEIMKYEKYLLYEKKGWFFVCFHDDAESLDVLKSVLHVSRFQKEKDLISSLKWTTKALPRFVAELDTAGWESDRIFWGDRGIRVDWNIKQ